MIRIYEIIILFIKVKNKYLLKNLYDFPLKKAAKNV